MFGTFASARPITAFGVVDLDRADACRPMAMLLTPWSLSASMRGEALPAEVQNDPQIQAAFYDSNEEARQQRLSIKRRQP